MKNAVVFTLSSPYETGDDNGLYFDAGKEYRGQWTPDGILIPKGQHCQHEHVIPFDLVEQEFLKPKVDAKSEESTPQ